jgi:hypothetical protein
MLDAVLSSMVGGWATDSYNKLFIPLLTVDYVKTMVIFVRFGICIVYTTILVLRHWNMLKPYQKESSIDVFSHTNLPNLEDIFSQVKYEMHWVGITLESLVLKYQPLKNL